jgi:hypothetical protein
VILPFGIPDDSSPGVLDIASSNPSRPVGRECAMDTDADADAEGSCVDKTRRACEADIDDIRAVSPSVKDLSVHGEGLYV